MSFTYLRRAAVALALTAATGCTIKDSQTPPVTGPSGLAHLLTVTTSRDSISQNGTDSATITVTALNVGQPEAGVSVRLDMTVNGVPQDFGTLSSHTIVTNTVGVGTVVFTAPPTSPTDVVGSCNGLVGTCISILATATGTNFAAALPESVTIRLVPPGLILPPVVTPVPSFVFTPASPPANSPAQFDASASCGGPLVAGSCPVNPAIASYAWNFGDGQSGTGQTVSHTFTVQQPYTVTLTVTNVLGGSASKSQAVTVGGGSLPTASFTVSPAQPVVGDFVFFNGLGSKAGPGHTISSYRWDFGDGATDSGQTISHVYTAAGTYNVLLTVTDDAGQSTTSAATAVSVGTGSPVVILSVTKTGSLSILADGSTTTASGSATLTTFTFFWGDGSTTSGSAPAASHTFTLTGGALSGTFTVTLRVTDSFGRIGTSTPQSVTVP